MSVTNGQKANQTTFNNAFMSRTVDTSTVGKLALNNSGSANIADAQKNLNAVQTATGADAVNTGTAFGAPAGTIADGDSHQTALTKLANKFHATTGHTHSGAAGDAPAIPASDISAVPLQAYLIKSTLHSSVTGLSLDVSADFGGYSQSTGSAVPGIVTDAIENRVVIRDIEGKPFVDGNDCEIYGRLTKAGAVWTLSFYVNVGGFESTYNFLTGADFYFFAQELVSPLGAPPVYSRLIDVVAVGGSSGGGGGGGGSLHWLEDDNAPAFLTENHMEVFSFDSGLGQQLYALIKVPASYTLGNPIHMYTYFYNADAAGNVLMQSIATLIRLQTDLMSSTANQRTSTNSAFTMSAPYSGYPQPLNFDLTSSIGQINGVNVSPGDLILVQLKRGADTAASAVKVPVYAAEVAFR